MRLFLIFFLALIASQFTATFGESTSEIVTRTIRIDGRSQTTITTPQILLGDIADVSSPRYTDDEAVIALRRIPITNSPMPGQVTQISGQEIVSKMRAAGVDLNRVGYAFPSEISVTRASRLLGLDEVRGAIESMLSKSGRDIELRDVKFDSSTAVAPGDISIEARRVGGNDHVANGKMNFDITVRSPSMPEIKVPTVAIVNEWREVPIATRPLGKGAVVGDQDLERARVNISALPREIAFDEHQVVGLEIKEDIAVGEVFRRDKMVMPVIVPAGSKVMMVVRTKLLDATASGVAMEAGIMGQEIKVKNETSKRVVSAIVKEKGLVEVVR